MDIQELKQRSHQIRTRYHELERQQDGHPWTPEQDALAFLTDAGLVGRLTMAHQGSWPAANATDSLDYKLAESIWWLCSLADSQGIDIEAALERFLSAREKGLND